MMGGPVCECKETIGRAVDELRDQGATAREIEMALIYWFHSVSRLTQKEPN